ncbi:hypothetical protein REPUB_Repub13aG0092600 [Reevesia pubescens]
MASSSSSSSRQVKHQVFLSFRGPDTRHGFTSHLLKALKDKGINVFFDEETLEKGEELSLALLRAIVKSQIAIIILSEDYASSKSCLAELSQIMDRKRTKEKIVVVPIFYHVNPSNVRHHGGSFKNSFDEHQSKRSDDQVQQWKDAFAEVGKLKGWHIEGGNFDRSEPDYIKVIVEDVIKKLNSKSTSGSLEFVGINNQKGKILKLINEENTRVIGIWGMGGIGKTTLAEAVYDEVSPKFAHRFFLLNVREKFEKQGMESLRNELVSKLLKQEIRIDTPSIGSTFIQERLRNQRVFVVLDDVNDSDQIEHLGVKHFGDGSKILVTSRDQQVLKNGADKIHEAKKLNDDDSLQLFSRFAFKQPNPVSDFRDLSKKFVDYAGGLPLALKVLGGTLFQKPGEVWESALDKLKEYPDRSILKVLQISFDGLDEVEKNIFLDFAFFFKGENKDDVTKLLSCCYEGAQFGISNLVDKCLVDLLPCDRFSMHDLLQEMGRDVVRRESKDAGKRSRLWSPKDVYQVFKNNTGTESIEGIMLDMSKIDVLQLCPTIFQKMIHLRVLKIYSSWYDENPCKLLLAKHDPESFPLPDELRCLWWDYYPSKSLPSKFNPKNLVELRLTHGGIKQLWNGDHQDFVNLRRLDLSHCKKLRKIPSLLGAIKLEVLDFVGCESLDELPSLKHLTSLQELNHGENYELKKFPEIPRDFFIILDLRNTKIEEVPDSIEHATGLDFLDMSNSRVKKVSSNISKLDDLHYINLCHCLNITELNFGPSSYSSLKDLRLILDYCKSLKFLSGLPLHLECIWASDCTSLEKVSFTYQYISEFDHNGGGGFFMFCNCFKLNQDSIDNILANVMLRIGFKAKQMADEYLRDKVHVSDNSHTEFCCLSGNEILEKFEHQSMNSSIILKIGPNRGSGMRFLVFTLCCVVDFKQCDETEIELICEGRLKAKGGKTYKNFESKFYFGEKSKTILGGIADGENVYVLFNVDMVHYDMDYEEASFEFYFMTVESRGKSSGTVMDDIKMEKCGVHVSYVEYKDVEKIHDDYTTKMRAGHKRKFSNDGEGKRGSKRLK